MLLTFSSVGFRKSKLRLLTPLHPHTHTPEGRGSRLEASRRACRWHSAWCTPAQSRTCMCQHKPQEVPKWTKRTGATPGRPDSAKHNTDLTLKQQADEEKNAYTQLRSKPPWAHAAFQDKADKHTLLASTLFATEQQQLLQWVDGFSLPAVLLQGLGGELLTQLGAGVAGVGGACAAKNKGRLGVSRGA
eukprot:1150751-Pelagomonas_calceolata.AAC.6